MTTQNLEPRKKTHEFEAGRIYDKDGKVLSIVRGRTEYREVEEPKNDSYRPGRYV